MATVRSLMQIAGTSSTHLDELKKLLKLKKQDIFLLSSAFVLADGVKPISNLLTKNSKVTEAFVGIRNGVTSIQGIMELIKVGVKVTVVDTGKASPIFHPKIYLVSNSKKAHVIIGSANLTHNGLNNNIEASALIELDLSKKNDKDYLKHVRDSYADLKASYPSHFTTVLTVRDAVKLYQEGLLEDERATTTRQVTTTQKGRKVAVKAFIPLTFKPKPSNKYRKFAKHKGIGVAPAGLTRLTRATLLWKKNKLKESHLQSPSKKTTNPVGGLRLGSAFFKVNGVVIDQTKYFRNTVFASLAWVMSPTPRLPHKETATANFEIIIGGVSFGVFSLEVSHEPDREANQNNTTTLIHWGKATSVIKQKNLIGRSLYLYEPLIGGLPYTIEIK